MNITDSITQQYAILSALLSEAGYENLAPGGE